MANFTVLKLKINGVQVKAPKVGGFSYKPEKVWSNNTGRTASCKMVGTIKAIKKTVSITWPALTEAEKDLIEAQISNVNLPFTTLEMTMPDGSTMNMECYFGTPTFDGFNLIGGQWRYETAKVDGIER